MERLRLKNINKVFYIEYRKPESALYKAKNIFKKKQKKELFVLKNINLSLNEGEIIGILGKNGSGKSTLLRVIAGIFTPDNGYIDIKGELVYLSGIDVGFQEKLTMRENIILAGSLLGLNRKEINKKIPEIISFSELEGFADVELSKFSSGMISRLAFSTTINCIDHSNPDILLLDEVFEGGTDIFFMEKAIKKVDSLIKNGSSVIIVSHNPLLLKKYCKRIILMDNGEIIKQGNPSEIIENYKTLF